MERSDRYAFAGIMLAGISLLLAGISIGYGNGSKIEVCQTIVLNDIIAHQKFQTDLMSKVNPDFLTVLGGKK